jgi:DNA-binding transcriptional MerR regulator
MGKYNISKTSKTVNISNELLRHYERLGLIEPERGENGYRFFSFRDLDKLQGIRRFRNMGFSLAEMEKLMYTGDYEQVGELYEQALQKASSAAKDYTQKNQGATRLIMKVAFE